MLHAVELLEDLLNVAVGTTGEEQKILRYGLLILIGMLAALVNGPSAADMSHIITLHDCISVLSPITRITAFPTQLKPDKPTIISLKTASKLANDRAPGSQPAVPQLRFRTIEARRTIYDHGQYLNHSHLYALASHFWLD
jgi:hypothetical protein